MRYHFRMRLDAKPLLYHSNLVKKLWSDGQGLLSVHIIGPFSKLRPHRIQDIELWERDDLDGYICQAIGIDEHDYPAKILSRYLGRDVLLVMKGPKPRPCSPTSAFPDLKATSMYQDGYPILLASEESLLSVQEKLRKEVGNQGVADRWSEDDLVMER